MTVRELKRRFPNWTEDFLKANAEDYSENLSSSPKPKRPVRDVTLAAPAREEGDMGRVVVRIRSFRTRLLDPDNLCPKFHIDGLRYAGLIRDDSPQDIILEVSQEKVATRKEERTEIEIGPFGPGQPTGHATMGDRDALIEKLWAVVYRSWNRGAFDAAMATMSEEDLRDYVKKTCAIT